MGLGYSRDSTEDGLKPAADDECGCVTSAYSDKWVPVRVAAGRCPFHPAKSAEQTIEDDEPMGSVPTVTPSQFDKILETGAIRENAQGGKKADGGKPRYELLPQRALAEVVKVLTHGAAKYGDFNYLKVEEHRYIGAIGRHMAQATGVSLDGSPASELDKDSGLLHLAHVACNALILLEQRLREEDK